MADELKTDERQRTLDVEQATPTQTPVVDYGKKVSRGKDVRGYMEAARDDLRERGDTEKADAIEGVLKDERFNSVVEKLEGKREQAAPVGGGVEDPNNGEAELDSTALEVQVNAALQSAVEAGMPHGQISAAKTAISAYQAHKSAATKGGVEVAVANSAGESKAANDEAAKKFNQQLNSLLVGAAGLAAVGSAGLAGISALFHGACDEAKEQNPKECAGVGKNVFADLANLGVFSVPEGIAAITKGPGQGKGGGMGGGNA